METSLPVRIPAKLEAAVQRVRAAVRSAAERTVDSLGLAALTSANLQQRDCLLEAQFELNRKLAIFSLSFNDALDLHVAREVGPTEAVAPAAGPTSWSSLSLVDDHEVEILVCANRFAQEISAACDTELRELDAHMATLLYREGAEEPERNPLRAEVLGHLMIRAVESVTDSPAVRKVLATEINRSLTQVMRATYADIVSDLRAVGVQAMGLTVRQRGGDNSSSSSSSMRDVPQHSRRSSLYGDLQEADRPYASAQEHATASGMASQFGGLGTRHGASRFGHTAPGKLSSDFSGLDQAGPAVDMMSLIRRLSATMDAFPEHASGWPEAAAADRGGASGRGDRSHSTHSANSAHTANTAHTRPTLVAPNLIQTHRDELRRASAGGAIDHMIIDVVAGLFDQILSDPKVPPQMARQIGRLQLPVLRMALGDNSFFSSRRHPVRRFINRIATLGTAVDDFDGDEGKALLLRVGELVQDIIDGDFEQIETYEHKLRALETFVADQASAALASGGAADQLLDRKESELRVQLRYAEQLDGALQPLPVPEFLRQFLGQVWSRAIASAITNAGASAGATSAASEQTAGASESALARRLREVGRELVMSVQPKGLPAQRAEFLRQLPKLMKDVNAGLDRIRCDDHVRREFFAQLLPTHAESMRGQAMSTLEHNLLAKQVDGALATPLPKPSELPPAAPSAVPVLNDVVRAEDFSPEEARAVGLLDEASVDWLAQVEDEYSAEAEITEVDIEIDIGDLPPGEPAEPMRGKSLADHVQIGFAYQMHLQGAWHKVRLAHVSGARTFFVLTHGSKQRQTISMTYRMLSRLCESGRFRAFENAYLLDRATVRARRQLAQLKPNH